MPVAYRSSSTVTNGTAGTSVTVSKPAGMTETGAAGADVMVAFIAAVGAPTFTAPAGWTLITTIASGSNVTLKAYWKLASSEAASFTWTLGSSQRNWGWISAYTGVHPTAPVSTTATDNVLGSSTLLQAAFIATPEYGMGVTACAAVRTASGAATTWTVTSQASITSTERVDLSTNAGAGTDISGEGSTGPNAVMVSHQYSPLLTASQNQTAGVIAGLTLVPYFVPYTGAVNGTGLTLEAAFDVDPDSDSSTWTWTDLTSFVLESSAVYLRHGRANRSSVADPSEMRFTLLNTEGEFTLPSGTYGTQMVRNLPLRVRLTGFGIVVGTTDGYHRGTAFLASLRPRWDASTNYSVVDIVAAGRLRRLQQRTDPLHSAAYTALQRVFSSTTGEYTAPVVYWPFEDESGATSAASAVSGVLPAVVSGFTFGADSTCVGSAPLAQLSAASALLTATVPAYAATGTWTVMFVSTMAAEPAAETVLLNIRTNGTAALWQVTVSPGAPSAVNIRAYSAAGVSLLNDAVSVTEADFYGVAQFHTVTVTQNGTGVDYVETANGGGNSGNVASVTAGNVVGFDFGPQAGLASAAFGHLALHVQPGADGTFARTPVVDGNSGERPSDRFDRLCNEQNVPYVSEDSENADLLMGPQTVSTLMTLLRDAEVVEGCVLNDSGVSGVETGVLWFPARDDRENIAAALTLDIAQSQVASIEPVLDDQDIVNDVEVSRTGGSSARVTDEVSIATEGRIREQVTVNTEDDTFLRHLAGLRVSLGTVKGMRFPAVSWNLRKSTTLAEQWLNTVLFNRIDILNPPSQYPPDDIAAILEGYEEQISAATWAVKGNLSPYQPYHVALMASPSADARDFLGRLAADPDCALRTAVNSSATSFVVDPNRCRWTTVADDFDPDINIRLGEEVVSVSNIATTAGTFVAAGTAAHADNASVTPTLPAGTATGDLLLILAAIRSAGTGTVSTPTGYTRLPVFAATDNVQLFAKVHSGSESNPTVSFAGGSAGDTTSANMIALHNTPTTLTDLADVVTRSATLVNTSAQDITLPSLHPGQEGCVVLYLGWKQDDWTSAATPTGFTEAFESSSTTGSDQAIVLGYVIQTTATLATPGSVVITGGASAISRGALVSIAAGYQTFTVSARSVNGVTKSHTAGTLIEVDDPGVLGM